MSKRDNIIAEDPLDRPPPALPKERVHELHRELTAKYAAEMARASWLGRIRIWFRIQREIFVRLEPRRSPHALYQTRSKD